jgi:hypothetical protein
LLARKAAFAEESPLPSPLAEGDLVPVEDFFSPALEDFSAEAVADFFVPGSDFLG